MPSGLEKRANRPGFSEKILDKLGKKEKLA